MNTNIKRKCRLGLLLGVICLLAGCNTYQEILQTKLIAIFGKDYKTYFWFSQPTDNYGVGTCYNVASGSFNNPITLDTNYICSTWSCINRDQNMPSNHNDLLRILGYADIGDGGPVTLSQSDQKDAALSGILPAFFKVLNIDASIDWTNRVQTDITLGDAYKRFLIPERFKTNVMALADTSDLKQSYLHGHLVVAVSDLIIDGITATITITNDIDGKLGVSLSNAVGTVVGNGASLQFSVDKTSGGRFNLTTTNLTVVAVLYSKWPTPSVTTTNISLLAEYSTPESFAPKAGASATIKDWLDYWKNYNFKKMPVKEALR
jgi:hypothetical protein